MLVSLVWVIFFTAVTTRPDRNNFRGGKVSLARMVSEVSIPRQPAPLLWAWGKQSIMEGVWQRKAGQDMAPGSRERERHSCSGTNINTKACLQWPNTSATPYLPDTTQLIHAGRFNALIRLRLKPSHFTSKLPCIVSHASFWGTPHLNHNSHLSNVQVFFFFNLAVLIYLVHWIMGGNNLKAHTAHTNPYFKLGMVAHTSNSRDSGWGQEDYKF